MRQYHLSVSIDRVHELIFIYPVLLLYYMRHTLIGYILHNFHKLSSLRLYAAHKHKNHTELSSSRSYIHNNGSGKLPIIAQQLPVAIVVIDHHQRILAFSAYIRSVGRSSLNSECRLMNSLRKNIRVVI